MKFRRFFPVFAVVLLLLSPLGLSAGTVQTKDVPKKGGGYYKEGYHLKGKEEKKPFVKREQNWRNPFKGFTKEGGKKKKGEQGSMPHSQ